MTHFQDILNQFLLDHLTCKFRSSHGEKNDDRNSYTKKLFKFFWRFVKVKMLTASPVYRTDLTWEMTDLRSSAVRCVVVGTRLVVACLSDRALLIAKGEPTTTISLDCELVAAAVSPDGAFLVLADSLATIHFCSLATGQVFFSMEIPGKKSVLGLAFPLAMTVTENASPPSLVVAISPNSLIRFAHLDLASVMTSLNAQDQVAALKLRQKISLETIHVDSLELINHVSLDVLEDGSECIYVAGSGDKPVSIWKYASDSALATPTTVMIDSLQLPLSGLQILKIGFSRRFLAIRC